MQVYSHSHRNDQGQKVGSKLLIEHLQGVKDKALQNFYPEVRFTTPTGQLQEKLATICWLHDLGKYTRFFQDYLLEKKPVAQELKAHSAFGAYAAYQLFRGDPEVALMAYYLIKMHHSNLLTIDQVLYPDSYNKHRVEDVFSKQQQCLLDFRELTESLPELGSIIFRIADAKTLFQDFKKYLKKDPSIERYFKINYLFSLLIEADKLDASDTERHSPVSIDSDSVDKREGFGKPTFPKDKVLKDFTQNELRNYVRHHVVDNLSRVDILVKRIFILAAPTGIGKTLTALDFALKLRRKIEVDQQRIPQIIYGLPFINIIEQALSEYEATITAGKIIGHYQYADIFGIDQPDEDEDHRYNQKKMRWDTWQCDVVITSFVQFFETLIGNRNRLLKKFHHMAGAIIILDEVQTLAIEKLPVIGAALCYLCKFLDARVLIMTATQPKIFELMRREMAIETEETLAPYNLLPQDRDVFACFNRTKIVPLLDEAVDDTSFLRVFLSRWTTGKNCIVVLNKVQRSIDVFNLLKDHFSQKKQEVALCYLSTNITPIERQRRIEQIKQELLPNKNCLLVSTQVVEAGVDLDFDMGFRDLGPINSIVQVAGRINRENATERKGSPLYVVDFGDCKKIYGYATDSQARIALQNHTEISENNYKEMVEDYFNKVAQGKLTDFDFSRQIFDAMQNLRYAYPSNASEQQKRDKKTVSDFQIIDKKQEGVSVFIEMPNDQPGTLARESYQLLLRGKTKKNYFEKHHKRDFNQRIIAVPKYLGRIAELARAEKLTDEILWVQSSDIANYYSSETGFIRSSEPKDVVISY